jgi:AdoMet-dependent rRNA methyltransferase SPB1
MQLKMTAPMDIGLDQQDLSLRTGQEDIFDIDTKDSNLRRTLRRKLVIDDEVGDIVVSSEDEAEYGMEDRGETMAQSGDENEQNLADLEAELDDMYEAYQDRLRERDAKYMVRAARNLKMDEWHGIESRDSGFESDGEEEIQNGGWDRMQKAKLQDSDTDDSSSESEEELKRENKEEDKI